MIKMEKIDFGNEDIEADFPNIDSEHNLNTDIKKKNQ